MNILNGARVVASGLVALVTASAVAHADPPGNPSANTASSSVSVVEPLTISRTADLEFGAFVRGPTFASQDTIEVPPNGGPAIYTPSTSFLPLPSVPPHVATFTITGEPGFEVVVTMPAAPIDLQAGALRLQSFSDDPALLTGYVVPPSGSVTYRVGGKLRVSEASAVTNGEHSVPFVLTVHYF